MTDLGDSLQRMSFAQLALLFAFLTGYVLTLGRLFEGKARRHAAVFALASAVGFVACTDPWVHGTLLVVFVIGGLSLFVVLVWLLGRWLAPSSAQPAVAQPAEAPVTISPGVEPARAAPAVALRTQH
jgi:hypothetical protein